MNIVTKLKVLYLPRWYPNRYDPMPGLFIERHARAAARWVEVAVLYLHQDDRLTGKRYETEVFSDDELLQIKLYYKPFLKNIPVIKPLINFYRFIQFYCKGIKMVEKEFGRPDLVHVNVLTRVGVIALLYKWLRGVPYVITEHWTRYLPHMDNFKGFWRKRVTRLVVRKASAVLPVTDNLRRSMERHGLKNRNYRVIPNVVDMKMFIISGRNEETGKKQFIHVSCFEDRQKNISGILRVLKKLSEVRQDWTCRMIGEGIHLDQLVNYAKELGIEGSFVHFTGLKENEELAGLMADANFQVMFSRFENLPVVILESYACGVPVISTNVGGIREHLDRDLGILIESEDETQLYNSLNEMLDHYKEYDKDKIRKYATEHFSKEVIGRQLADIYVEVWKRGNRK